MSARKRLSTREVAYACTYDPCDDTDTGVCIQVYSDGRLALTSHSRWSGSWSGERWLTDAGHLDLANPYGRIRDYAGDAGAEELQEDLLRIAREVEDALDGGQGEAPRGWRQVNRGWVV